MSGLLAAGLAASLIGEGVNAYSQNQNMRKQDNQAAASIIAQGQLRQKANQETQNLTTQIAKSNPQPEQTAQTAAYVQALQQANPVQASVNPAVKGASKRYAQDTAAAQQDVANYARNTASSMAAVAAPQLQRIGEGNQIANTASDLGLINDQSNNDQALLKTQLAGDATNPWLNATGLLLTGAGSGLSSYAGYKRGGTPGTPATVAPVTTYYGAQ